MEDSVFTKIIKGEIPSYKIYEDDKTYAFLDIHPKSLGHTLVIPKNQVEFVWDLPDDEYQALMTTVKKVASRIKQVLNSPYVGELVVGVEVPHAHVHLYAFDSMADASKIFGPELVHDEQSLTELANRLAF